ncbi:DoxX family protein [Leeia sp. TBRC 13508]|uniref:DoxX family protein n=1 Tax=Leeia speluncae TaxID=2884804 RepID=A0ABS8D551_9NEIS|nr:DoxX family protein [Leeia speluncae]MCB6183307.1 DoxX family protein [Leeia speluncae]
MRRSQSNREWQAPWLTALQSIALLLMRIEIFRVFFRSGLTKIDDWSITIALFTDEYHVPLLPPSIAAPLATGGELIFSALLIAGLFGRWAAIGLFGVNAMAVIAYWHGLVTPASVWTPGLYDHWQWGLMLFALSVFGTGGIGLDRFRKSA